MHPTQHGAFVAPSVLARAAASPEADLLSDRARTVTGAELRDLVRRLAGGLAARGVGHGDVIAILPTTSVEAVAVRYAAALIGAATAYCPPDSPERAAAFAHEVGATVAVVLPETRYAARLLREHLTVLTLGDLLRSMPAPLPAQGDPHALGWLVSSGGTTGQARASRRSFAEWARCVSGPVDTGRRQLVCTSLVHVGQVLVDQTLLGGGAVVLRDQGTSGDIDAAEVLQTIEAERITHLCLVEPQLAQLVDHPDLTRRNLRSLVAVSHIGADAAPSLRRRLLRRLEHAGLEHVLAHTYGASELGVVSMLSGSDYSSDRPGLLGSTGRPLPGVHVTIERGDGTRADAGEAGRIVVSSPATAAGVRSSGDIGFVDADGYLSVRGRAGDARGSHHDPVFPVDVQDALCAHPGVRYAVALPTETGFDAFVVPMTEHRWSTSDLLTFVLRQYGERLLPENVVVGPTLPLTEQGKPDRVAIGARFTTHTQVA
jgi:fatty-acyl-CoA synthase